MTLTFYKFWWNNKSEVIKSTLDSVFNIFQPSRGHSSAKSLILSLSCFCCVARASLMGPGLTSELCWASIIIKYAVYHTTGRSVSLPNKQPLHLLVCIWTLCKIWFKSCGTFKRRSFSPSNWYIRWMESNFWRNIRL